MSTQVQVFDFDDSHVRAVADENGNPLFVAKDVALALGYRDTVNAIKQHCKGVVKHHPIPDRLGRVQNVRVISEGDVYRLIASSKLPSAQRFESWIFDEVVPAVRKHGAYMTENVAERVLTDPDFLIQLATNLKMEREARARAEKRLEAQRPQVLFARAVETSQSSILVSEMAKILRQNGVDIGAKRLFQWFRDHHYLSSRRGEEWNLPTQWCMDKGYFEIKKSTHQNPDGSTILTRTPKLTGLGQQHVVSVFLDNYEAVSYGR